MDKEALGVKKVVSLDTRTNIKQSFTLVEQLSQQLIDSLVPEDAPHLVFTIPTRDTVERDGDILIQPIKGEQAWLKALESYKLYFRLEEQHPMATYRLPGIIYAKNFDEIQPIVEALNEAKKQLKQRVTHIPSGQRNRVTTESLPGVILLQVYRKVMAFNKPTRRFVFSWAKRTAGSEKVTPEEVLVRINDDIRQKVKGAGELFADLSMAQLNGEKSMIESLDFRQELRYYRKLALHPRLMAFDKLGSVGYTLNYHANLPMITKYDPKTKIRALPNYSTKEHSPKQRKDHKSKTLLIPRLYLYALNDE